MAMLRDVVRRRRRWAHATVIHDASHFYHERRVAWVSISMHACDPGSYSYGAPLGGPSGRRSSLMHKQQFLYSDCLRACQLIPNQCKKVKLSAKR